MQMKKQHDEQHKNEQLPVSRNQDVEFSTENADEDDLEAIMRAKAAEQRQREE